MRHKVEEPFPGFLRPAAQVRPPGEPGARFYDPGRDVAHLCDPILGIACGMLDEDPDLLLLRRQLGVTGVDLTEAVQAMVDFVRLDDPKPGEAGGVSFQRHLESCRLNETSPEARLLLFSAIGELFMVAGWQGKRAAAVYDHAGRKLAEVDTGQQVADAAVRLAARIYMPKPWRERLRLIWRILRGK